jgi:hypothetical protein
MSQKLLDGCRSVDEDLGYFLLSSFKFSIDITCKTLSYGPYE